MKRKNLMLFLGATFLLGSCSGESSKNINPIGKYDHHVKGVIDEDMPSFTSAQMKKQGEIINPALKWQHLDLADTKMYGVSSDKAYQDLKLTQKKTVIVAVIDSGVDYLHEDLKDNMWINQGEKPGNGKDDDGNGYVDDIHGWNFLGGADGRNLGDETLEETRILKSLNDKMAQGIQLSVDEKKIYPKVKALVTKNLNKYSMRYTEAISDQNQVATYLDILKIKLGLQNIDSREKIEDIVSGDFNIVRIKNELLVLWDKYWRGFAGISSTIKQSAYYVKIGYNVNFDGRANIIGDDPNDFNDTNYGNNDVIGANASHGTHVAGIIAAKRNNGIGTNGIAGNVKIMALRVVPNGDERDKDIALAVRYAVDNGAQVINMSFGKKFSPYKDQVNKAFEYAARNGVLLFHAAGNSSLNIDSGENNFPNSYIQNGGGVLVANKIQNWIEVGASTSYATKKLVARFSNYGNTAVTLFSPGSKIYAPTPNNTYSSKSGTSMAAPVAAGVAALLMSEFPNLPASKILNAIYSSLSKPKVIDVLIPSEVRNSQLLIPFTDLSRLDGVINVYQAVEQIRTFQLPHR